jgi:hypothetical protein
MFLGGRFLSLIFVIGFTILPSVYAQNSSHSYVKALYSLPLSLDPIKMNDTASLAVGNLIYDGLLKLETLSGWHVSHRDVTLGALGKNNSYHPKA